MTEAEALDMAAKAAGWGSWENAVPKTRELSSIRAHARTLMENAALKAENERLREERRLAWNEAIKAAAAFIREAGPSDDIGNRDAAAALRALTKDSTS